MRKLINIIFAILFFFFFFACLNSGNIGGAIIVSVVGLVLAILIHLIIK